MSVSMRRQVRSTTLFDPTAAPSFPNEHRYNNRMERSEAIVERLAANSVQQ